MLLTVLTVDGVWVVSTSVFTVVVLSIVPLGEMKLLIVLSVGELTSGEEPMGCALRVLTQVVSKLADCWSSTVDSECGSFIVSLTS